MSGIALVDASFDLIEFSCPNSDLKVRDPSKGHEIVAIFDGEGGKHANTTVTASRSVLVMEYMAPRRNCRVNIRVKASARDANSSLASSERLRANWPLQTFYRQVYS